MSGIIDLKDREGNQLTSKEYMKRWKQGIAQVTPLQQTRIQVKSTWIMLVGIAAGLVISIINYRSLWWLGLILLAALINTGIQQNGLLQKRNMLESIELNTQEVENAG